MNRHQTVTAEPGVVTDRGVVDEPVARPVERRSGDGYNQVLRLVGLVVAAVPTVIGLIAVAKIDWSSNGFDSAPVVVGKMTFAPWIAVATVVAGLIAMLAAASADRASKLAIGALLACGGLAVFLSTPVVEHVTLVARYGVMFFVVGVILAVTGALMQARRVLV